MKQKLFLSLLFIMTVFALTSCDSLWEHENKEAVEISFTIPQEWLDSFVEEAEAVQQSQRVSGEQRLQRASVDTSITANVSIHDAEKGVVLAKQTVNLGENLNQNISLGPLYIVGATVYVEVELTQYGHLSRIRKSDPRTVVKGMNTLTFDMGEAELNVTKMTADFNSSSGILTVKPDPNGTDLKAAIEAEITAESIDKNTITEVIITPPSDGSKIIPERDLSGLFNGYSALTNIIGEEYIETTYVTNMNRMFNGARELTSLDVSGWDTSSVTNMQDMFSSAENITSLNVSGWDTSSVEAMGSMFSYARELTSLDVSRWDTSSVTYMNSMFRSTSSLTSLDVSGWDTSSVTDMGFMFKGLSGLTSLDVSSWDTSSVLDMEEMFEGASGLTSLDVSSWDTSSLDYTAAMFAGASSLRSLVLSSWDTSKITSMNAMFYGATALTSLDLSNWNAVLVTDAGSMFYGCDSLAGGIIVTGATFSDAVQTQIDTL